MAGVGLKDHPGYIPHDPFLLERISFVGLTGTEVIRLLGPPHPGPDSGPSRMTYFMRGIDHRTASSVLTLSFADRWSQYEAVRAEYLLPVGRH